MPRLPFAVDFGRAFFAVALSVLLYFVSISETNPETRNETSFSVPVQPVNVPAGLVVTSQPSPVRVWVRAPLSVFSGLTASSFTATVDATTALAGDNSLPVAATSSDPQIRTDGTDPPNLVLHLEEIREQDLPVRANLSGQVPSGYQPGTATVDPARVTVAGAASLVGRATEAIVDVNLNGATVSINGVYTPRIVDQTGNDLSSLNLRMTPPSVNVQLPITQQTQYKEVGVHPVTAGQPAPGYLVLPLEVNPPTVTLAGDAAALGSVNFAETQPIDINGVNGTTVRTVALIPAPGTLLLQQGQTVTVTIRVTTLVVQQTVRVPASVINVGPNLQLAGVPDPVAVTISGPAPTLTTLALNPGDFQVVVDVSGKGAGQYDLAPKLQKIPSGLTLQSVEPKTVHVKLSEAPAPTPTAGPPG